jgi:hypothetical protein
MSCGNKVVIHDPAARRVVQTPGRDRIVTREPSPTTITPAVREKVVVHDPVTDLTVTKPVVRRVEIVAEGPQGPKGAPGGSVPPIPFAYGDAPSIVWTPDAAGVITIVRLDILVAFNQPSTIKVGVIGNTEALLRAQDNDPSSMLDYEVAADFPVVVGQGVWLEISPGGGTTQGSGVLYVTFIPE